MKEALYYKSFEDHLDCYLCPHNCSLKSGKTGICRVRKNINGTLIAENYGLVSALHSDPIEKKPLYHFFPGRKILSVGGIGCNLHCKFCQNWEISQSGRSDYPDMVTTDVKKILGQATLDPNNIGVAYTYNEPTIWIECMLDIAIETKAMGLKNVMVTNGYINPEPLQDLLAVMDAFSVDLKAFTESFYQKLTHSKLQPVLDTLRTIRNSGKYLEVTNLVIPDQNDNATDFEGMVNWIADELGAETVLHISRYFPTYQLNEPPTPEKKLLEFYHLARKRLHYVYLGNLRTSNGQNTYCPACNSLLISRTGYNTDPSGLDYNGKCLNCKQAVILNQHLHFK